MNRVLNEGSRFSFLIDPLCYRYPGGVQICEQRLLYRLR